MTKSNLYITFCQLLWQILERTAAACPFALRHSYSAAPRRIPERRRASGPPDSGRIRTGRDYASSREKLDLQPRGEGRNSWTRAGSGSGGFASRGSAVTGPVRNWAWRGQVEGKRVKTGQCSE